MPLVFGGHESTVKEFENVFANYDIGENQSVLISGLRGAGKTSMLGTLEDLASKNGWLTIREDAGRGLMDRVMDSSIPTILTNLSQEARVRLTGLGLWNFNANFEYVDRKREAKPLLRFDLVAISKATDNSGILILVDEVSSGKTALSELSRFALEVSHAISADINLVVVFAGVKVDLNELLKQPHMTFLRRSRQLDFRRLSAVATRQVLRGTTKTGGRELDLDAEEHMIATSQGYPYLVQLVGDYAWHNSSSEDPEPKTVTLADAEAARSKAIVEVEARVISRVYADLSDVDQNFLKAMALDVGKSKMANINERMGVTPQYANTYRQRLIDSGYVQVAGHGYVEFSLPYLVDYVRGQIAGSSDPDSETVTQQSGGWDEFPPPVR